MNVENSKCTVNVPHSGYLSTCMLHCACAEDVGTNVGHPVPVSASRTYRYIVTLSEVLCRYCKKCACISFNVNM